MEPYEPTDQERAELASQLEIAKQEWEEDMQHEKDKEHYPFCGETMFNYATDFDYMEDYA